MSTAWFIDDSCSVFTWWKRVRRPSGVSFVWTLSNHEAPTLMAYFLILLYWGEDFNKQILERGHK